MIEASELTVIVLCGSHTVCRPTMTKLCGVNSSCTAFICGIAWTTQPGHSIGMVQATTR